MNKDKLGKPPSRPSKPPSEYTSSSLVTRQQVRRRQQWGRHQRHMQNVLQRDRAGHAELDAAVMKRNQVGLLSWLQA
jgi:hypothetical protein